MQKKSALCVVFNEEWNEAFFLTFTIKYIILYRKITFLLLSATFVQISNIVSTVLLRVNKPVVEKRCTSMQIIHADLFGSFFVSRTIE